MPERVTQKAQRQGLAPADIESTIAANIWRAGGFEWKGFSPGSPGPMQGYRHGFGEFAVRVVHLLVASG